ncbi:MAG TPA: discoidin domain-containing protein, partial [Candidatus Eremiobacteraceae bacterium]|nr:discoidin domain-containing protein [Candidatus Eremiobacteraceae bacterium]
MAHRMHQGQLLVLFAAMAALMVSAAPGRATAGDASFAGDASIHAAVVDITPGHQLNAFDPIRSLGAGVDSQNAGAVKHIYTPTNVAAMLSAGWGPVTYRLYTELSVQDWHWNPYGTWSRPDGRGYWIGATSSPTFVRDTYGYRLPHRGFTYDQGNNDDYSRLDDGNPNTYWKSDPYLTQRYTGESDSLHPQWIVVDLGAAKPVDAIRIAWASPFARRYAVQYWTGDDAIYDPAHGLWITYAGGSVSTGDGGTVTLRLRERPAAVEYIRILMDESSNTCDSHGPSDVRDCVGYAVQELYIGTVDERGGFHDLMHHVA